jgi:hypothetical protein
MAAVAAMTVEGFGSGVTNAPRKSEFFCFFLFTGRSSYFLVRSKNCLLSRRNMV